jgi:hypothetical protein
MSSLRVLKAVTVYAFLVVVGTRVAFHFFNGKDFNKFVGHYNGWTFILIFAFVALTGAASLLSIPITAAAGLVGMAMAKRSGSSAFTLGFFCFALSAANFLLWTKYGSMPFKVPFCDWCNHP